ncbi:MAG: hypothetical protein LBI29_02465 [Rickettsiales bacterium]|nr:hypothetical protein [Rickettsiales bacterium]
MPFSFNSECLLNEPEKTDRTGTRTEFCIKTTLPSGKAIDWELMNCTCITHLAGKKLDNLTIEAAGCLERLLVIAEGVDEVLKTSAFDQCLFLALSEKTPERTALFMLDILRTANIMALSGYDRVPRKSRQYKTFRVVLNCLINNVVVHSITVEEALSLLRVDFETLRKRKYIGPDSLFRISIFWDHFEKLMKRKELVKQKIEQHLENSDINNTKLITKLANQYNGGDEVFVCQLQKVKIASQQKSSRLHSTRLEKS